MRTNYKKRIGSCVWVLVLIFFLQSCSFIFYPSPETFYSHAKQSEPYDAIIVPGLPFTGDRWSPLLKRRIIWAHHLYSRGIAKNVIFSGSAVYSPYIEAEIMALYGEALGIERRHIYTENTAEHSTENLYYSYKLAQKLGFKRIALATDIYQGRYLYFFSKKKKIPVTSIPTVIDTVKKSWAKEPIIDYQSAQVDNFISLPERKNFFQRLRGTRGKNIVFENESMDQKEVYNRTVGSK